MKLHEFLDCHYGADGAKALRRRLAAGEDPEERVDGETALHVAVRRRRVQAIEILLAGGATTNLLATLAWSIPELVALAINVFLFAILIQVILSWVSPGGYNPAATLIHTLTEPLLRPARRLIPPFSGLDLSPMLVMVGLVLLKMLLLPPLQVLMATPFR